MLYNIYYKGKWVNGWFFFLFVFLKRGWVTPKHQVFENSLLNIWIQKYQESYTISKITKDAYIKYELPRLGSRSSVCCHSESNRNWKIRSTDMKERTHCYRARLACKAHCKAWNEELVPPQQDGSTFPPNVQLCLFYDAEYNFYKFCRGRLDLLEILLKTSNLNVCCPNWAVSFWVLTDKNAGQHSIHYTKPWNLNRQSHLMAVAQEVEGQLLIGRLVVQSLAASLGKILTPKCM